MQNKERNEQSSADYNEEWETSDSRYVPGVWDQDVQDWEKLE